MNFSTILVGMRLSRAHAHITLLVVLVFSGDVQRYSSQGCCMCVFKSLDLLQAVPKTISKLPRPALVRNNAKQGRWRKTLDKANSANELFDHLVCSKCGVLPGEFIFPQSKSTIGIDLHCLPHPVCICKCICFGLPHSCKKTRSHTFVILWMYCVGCQACWDCASSCSKCRFLQLI